MDETGDSLFAMWADAIQSIDEDTISRFPQVFQRINSAPSELKSRGLVATCEECIKAQVPKDQITLLAIHLFEGSFSKTDFTNTTTGTLIRTFIKGRPVFLTGDAFFRAYDEAERLIAVEEQSSTNPIDERAAMQKALNQR